MHLLTEFGLLVNSDKASPFIRTIYAKPHRPTVDITSGPNPITQTMDTHVTFRD